MECKAVHLFKNSYRFISPIFVSLSSRQHYSNLGRSKDVYIIVIMEAEVKIDPEDTCFYIRAEIETMTCLGEKGNRIIHKK